VELDDGRRVFAKVARDDETRGTNRNERVVLEGVRSRHFPNFVAATTDGTVLLIEDLSGADWDPPVLDDVEALWAAITSVGQEPGPLALFQAFQGSGRDPWSAVLADARFATAVGVDAEWLSTYGPELAAAAVQADTSGDRLLHGDVGPGNWCRRADRTWVFVDWASAYRGNPLLDHAIASIRLTRVHGRPVISPAVAETPAMVAFVAGRFAGELLDHDWTIAPAAARAARVGDIRAGLVVSAHLLGLRDPSH